MNTVRSGSPTGVEVAAGQLGCRVDRIRASRTEEHLGLGVRGYRGDPPSQVDGWPGGVVDERVEGGEFARLSAIASTISSRP